MTVFYCADCGARGSKADMVVSRFTSHAYCVDERACLERQERQQQMAHGWKAVRV